MKHFQIKWIVLSIGVALLAACSSGGGGTPAATATAAPNTLSISNTITPATQALNVADTTNSIMSAHTNSTENKTVIQICRDVDQDNDCSQLVILTLDGTTAQSYPITSDSPSQIIYQDDDAVEGIVNHYISTSGEINVTRLDNQFVVGTFSATVECNWGCTGTVPISGNFNIPISPLSL